MMQFNPTENPFPGLRPFELDESNLFFGREGQSDELLARLQRTRFLAVVGTSGSGKSSLIRAGLLPALYGGLMGGAGSSWNIAIMRPGNDPIGNLAAALGELAPDQDSQDSQLQNTIIETSLRRSTLGLIDAVQQARLEPHENLLIVVDQFEELFRFKDTRKEIGSEDDASAFVQLLIEASVQTDLPIYVVLTMRSDFLGDCSQFVGLPEAINQGQYLIPRMSRDERRAAITGPVAVGGGQITLPLVSRLLNDVGDNPDQLPILQHALMRTWDYSIAHRRNGAAIGLEDYEAIGTMSEALSRHADEAFGELPDNRSREIAEKLFKRLTEKGADNRETRRPTRLAEICAVAEATEEEVVAVIDVFRQHGRSFLMPPVGVELSGDTVIDISHESLIRNWDRLRAWVDDEAQSARIYRRLADAATDYYKKAGGLLDDVTLQYVMKWHEQVKPQWAWGVRYHTEFNTAISYLELSTLAHDARIEAEQERDRRELETTRAVAEAERQRNEERAAAQQRELEQAQDFAEKQARSAKRLRRFTFALVLISLLAFVAAGTAAYAYRNAKISQKRAEDSEKRTKDLAGDLKESQRSVEEGRREVKVGYILAEALRQKANEKEQKALAEEKKAAAAKADAEKKEEIAKIAQANAKAAKTALVIEKQIDDYNRDALAAFQRGNFDRAETGFAGLVKTFSTDSDKSRLASAQAHLGESRHRMGKLDESIKDLTEAREIQHQRFKEVKAPDDKEKEGAEYVDTLRWLGQAQTDKGQYEAAVSPYTEAVEIERSASNLESLARSLRNLGRYDEALANYNEALDLRRKNPNSPELLNSLREMAKFHMEQDNFDKTFAVYGEILRTQEKYLEPDDPNIADTFSEIGSLYGLIGDITEGEELLQGGSTVLQNSARRNNRLASIIRLVNLSKDNADKASAMEKLAAAYAAFGSFRRAGLQRKRALELRNQAIEPVSTAMMYPLIEAGDFFRDMAITMPDGEDRKETYASAISAYERARVIGQAKGSAAGMRDALEHQAECYLDQANFSDAERLYKQALEIRERNKGIDTVAGREEGGLAANLDGQARAEVGLKKFPEAEANFLRAQKVFDGISKINLQMLKLSDAPAIVLRQATQARLAELYASQGRLVDAEAQYEPLTFALKEIEPGHLINARTFQSFLDLIDHAGKFYSERGDNVTAEKFYRFLLPEEQQEALLKAVPDSCADSMLRILSSYEALLEKLGLKSQANDVKNMASVLETRLADEKELKDLLR